MYVVFIDSEGLNDTDKNKTLDTRILAYAMLLSSHVIFNCMKVLDGEALESLRLVSEITNRFKISNAERHHHENVEPTEYA